MPNLAASIIDLISPIALDIALSLKASAKRSAEPRDSQFFKRHHVTRTATKDNVTPISTRVMLPDAQKNMNEEAKAKESILEVTRRYKSVNWR